MSDAFQRNQAEKELFLLEIQMLKQQAKASGSLAFMGQEEKDHWNRLLDSNMRAGTMACMWCMKAQLVKKTSLAFHKWKFAVARVTWNRSISPNKLNNSSNGLHNTATADRHNSTGPMSAVLANAISLVHHLKENEVEGNINTKLFMSPSASVNAANAAATSVLQYDLNNLGNPGESAESLEAYNKQRLAYVLRSLHENTQAEPARQHSLNLDGSRRGDSSGINLSTEEGLDAYLRSALLSNDADSETKRQILLALSHTVAARPLSGSLPLRDPLVTDRSSLSLLKGVAGSKPTPGGSQSGRGRANSRSLSPNARMHSRARVVNNSAMSPDTESVHFFSASDVDPLSLPSSRGASIHLDGRPQREQREQRDHRDGGYHATDYHGIGAAKGGYLEHADSFGSASNPSRTYPPASYSSQQSTLLPSGQRGEGASSNKRGHQQQQQVPRYLMPTNSYRKKRTSLPESARSAGNNRRSRSPTMITNSNSKHAVNVFGSHRHSPTAAVAYTVKEAIARSRSTTPNGTQRSGSVSLSYGDLTFADYQQRKGAESGRRHSQSQSTPYATGSAPGGAQGSPHQAPSGSFLDSVTQGIADYYASPPPPPPSHAHATSGLRSSSQPGGRGGQAIHLPLPPVPLSLPDASYFMQPPAAPAPEQVYQQYDAYHSSTLRTNSADIHDAQYGHSNHHQGQGAGDASHTAFAGSGDVLMDEDVILHSGFEHAPVRGDVYHSQQVPVLPYVAAQQHTRQTSAPDASQGAAAPNARRKSRSTSSSEQAGKDKPRPMDRAQLELMMHGDVYDRPASWYKSLRNK